MTLCVLCSSSRFNNNKLYRLSGKKEEAELGDITNYVTDASPTSFFKRSYSEDAFLDEAPAKVAIGKRQNYSWISRLTFYYLIEKEACGTKEFGKSEHSWHEIAH